MKQAIAAYKSGEYLDAVARLQPGVLHDEASHRSDSFQPELDGLLDCPHYTRPEVFEGQAVPDVLVSGHHQRIARWRREQSLLATLRKRPDLIEAARRATAGERIAVIVLLPAMRGRILTGTSSKRKSRRFSTTRASISGYSSGKLRANLRWSCRT